MEFQQPGIPVAFMEGCHRFKRNCHKEGSLTRWLQDMPHSPPPGPSVGWHKCSPLLASTRLSHGNLRAISVWLRLPQSCTTWVSSYPGVQPSPLLSPVSGPPTVGRLALPVSAFSHPFPSQAFLSVPSDSVWASASQRTHPTTPLPQSVPEHDMSKENP